MKRAGIIIINIIIMTAILVFVGFYTILENENSLKRQTEHFENTTIAMENVTENYLEGEQRICDVWARYINSKDMTMEEAASFIRISHVLQNASAHTVSGREKRENESTAFKEHPFSYAFTTIPTTSKGGYFIDSPLIQFSVNKDCDNLAMTNEFMRFLISSTELNQVAAKKCIMGSTKDYPFENYYAPFKNVSQDLIIHPTTLGVQDSLAIQIRIASYQVGTGTITIEEAIQKYGTFE